MEGKQNIKITIKKSVVIVSPAAEGSKEVEALLKRFDLANATPLDGFDFLRRLKSLLK